MTAGIGDDAVRKYYRQDFSARLSQFFAPAQGARGNRDFRGQGQNWRDRGQGQGGFGGQGGFTGQGGFGGERRGGGFPPRNGAFSRPVPGARNTPYVVVSQQLAASPVHRGSRVTVPLREALILQAALSHPWLLHDHLEELSQLEFRHADAERLKGALIDIAAHADALDAAALTTELAARGLTESARAHCLIDHHGLGLGRPAGGRPGRRFGDLAAACRLASAVAFTN